jgi:hypothetical protein
VNEYFIKSDDDILDLADERRAAAAMADDDWHGGPIATAAEIAEREAEYAEEAYIPDTEEEMRPRYDEDSDEFYDPRRVGAPPVWENPEALAERKPADRVNPKKPEAA